MGDRLDRYEAWVGRHYELATILEAAFIIAFVAAFGGLCFLARGLIY